ncbi:hypothetical protein [Nocardia seriolae]|uniref:hypothetical protein n=1 Tax=Nocardia seriolae TaxID=37332 RepID=UPI0009DD4DAA|nr:hypothetical protein [Nocardia seriolae]MTJ64415.1 hypothetical protein [Nocardia seriolae]MTJ75393.1 hypothetical protein [Nocardia seriolae]MTJ87590.1 hypothetical protein [Nocardia seriolae]MTK31582.1 hypothetical protein [Nocardia seriolae]MTK42286.1 hypothetical protein [Nocardia seriolae]
MTSRPDFRSPTALVIAAAAAASILAGATAAARTHHPPAPGRTLWPAPAHPAAAVRASGLPMLTGDDMGLHIHAHLDVLVNGRPVAVPADVGVDLRADTMSPLHTHDDTGVLHVEAPAQGEFTLGEFLTEWSVPLSADRLGNLHTGDGATLRAYVNGIRQPGDPAAIVLHAHDEIALLYDTSAPSAIPPDRYLFDPGE